MSHGKFFTSHTLLRNWAGSGVGLTAAFFETLQHIKAFRKPQNAGRASDCKWFQMIHAYRKHRVPYNGVQHSAIQKHWLTARKIDLATGSARS